MWGRRAATTDISERVTDLERAVDVLRERADNQEGWSKRQNGSVDKLEGRLHSLERWIMATLAAALASLVVTVLTRR